MRGLPQNGAYETILRDAMTADQLEPTGIYFGTRSGDVYGSIDEGKTWKKVLDGLPSVVCVRAAVFGDPRISRGAKPGSKPKADRNANVRAGSKVYAERRPPAKAKSPAKTESREKTKSQGKAKLRSKSPSSAQGKASQKRRPAPALPGRSAGAKRSAIKNRKRGQK